MIKLDVTNQTTYQIVERLQADFNASVAIEAAKVGGEPTPDEVEAAKQHAEAVKANASFFKENLKIALTFVDRPALSAETLETLERMNADLAENAKKILGTCIEQFNALVELYQKTEEISPTAKGWFSGGFRIPALKNVVKLDEATGSTELPAVKKSAEQTYTEALAACRTQRDDLINKTGQIDYLRGTLVVQLQVFQDPDYHPVQAEMEKAKQICADQRDQIKKTQASAKELLKQVNEAIAYVGRPPISAQDLETLKRFNPDYAETATKAQETCKKHYEHLVRQRILVSSCLKQMDKRLPVLEGVESQLVALIKNDGKPLSSLGSATAYYIPYDVNKPLAQSGETPELVVTTSATTT